MRYFVAKYAREMNRKIETIPAEAMEALAAILAGQYPRTAELHRARRDPLAHEGVAGAAGRTFEQTAAAASTNLNTLEEAERSHILKVLGETNGVVGGRNGAAQRLGLKRTTLIYKMQKLGITRLAT